MASDKIPDDVRELITAYITSVEQVEILLLLRRRAQAVATRDSCFTAREISDELRSSERSVSQRLAPLVDAGLIVASHPNADVRCFRYQPKDDALARATTHLAESYDERRYTVIDLIFSKPIDRLRLYADAFRFRREGKDG